MTTRTMAQACTGTKYRIQQEVISKLTCSPSFSTVIVRVRPLQLTCLQTLENEDLQWHVSTRLFDVKRSKRREKISAGKKSEKGNC